MTLVIDPSGAVRCVYSETIDLRSLGELYIRRGSFVEPDETGRWLVDLAPVAGPRLGPFGLRSAALKAEDSWLTDHWLLARA